MFPDILITINSKKPYTNNAMVDVLEYRALHIDRTTKAGLQLTLSTFSLERLFMLGYLGPLRIPGGGRVNQVNRRLWL